MNLFLYYTDFLPTKFDSITPNTLPSLPLRSWTSVLTLHLTRLTNNLGLNLNLSNDNNQEEGEEEEDNNNNVYGLNNLIKIIKSTQGWKGWVGEELGNSIGWNSLKVCRTFYYILFLLVERIEAGWKGWWTDRVTPGDNPLAFASIYYRLVV